MGKITSLFLSVIVSGLVTGLCASACQNMGTKSEETSVQASAAHSGCHGSKPSAHSPSSSKEDQKKAPKAKSKSELRAPATGKSFCPLNECGRFKEEALFQWAMSYLTSLDGFSVSDLGLALKSAKAGVFLEHPSPPLLLPLYLERGVLRI